MSIGNSCKLTMCDPHRSSLTSSATASSSTFSSQPPPQLWDFLTKTKHVLTHTRIFGSPNEYHLRSVSKPEYQFTSPWHQSSVTLFPSDHKASTAMPSSWHASRRSSSSPSSQG